MGSAGGRQAVTLRPRRPHRALTSGRSLDTVDASTPRPLDGDFGPVPGRVFSSMPTLVLIDGQNLFHLARRAWAPSPSDPSSFLLGQVRRQGAGRCPCGESAWTGNN